MPRPNPTWLKGTRKGRQKTSDRWYIKVNERYGVTADKYNIILTETGNSNGKALPWGRAYTKTFSYMAEVMQEKGVGAEEVKTFKERTKDFKTEMKDGKLVVHIPEGFVMDESPFKEEEVA